MLICKFMHFCLREALATFEYLHSQANFSPECRCIFNVFWLPNRMYCKVGKTKYKRSNNENFCLKPSFSIIGFQVLHFQKQYTTHTKPTAVHILIVCIPSAPTLQTDLALFQQIFLWCTRQGSATFFALQTGLSLAFFCRSVHNILTNL